jgi:hypothetical protein
MILIMMEMMTVIVTDSVVVQVKGVDKDRFLEQGLAQSKPYINY